MTRKATPANLLDELIPTTSETTAIRGGLRWDYSQAGDAADEVQRHAVEIKRSERRASEAIIEAGEHLLAVKGLLAHGQWLDWLGVEFGMSDRTAQRMMSVAEQFAGKSDTVSNLSTTVLYLLAADSTPEPARAAVLEQAQAGETVTKAQAQAVIDAHKPRVYESGLPVLDIRMPSQTRYIPEKRRAELLRAGYGVGYNPQPPYGDGLVVARYQGQTIGVFTDGDAAWLANDEHAKTQTEDASKAQGTDIYALEAAVWAAVKETGLSAQELRDAVNKANRSALQKLQQRMVMPYSRGDFDQAVNNVAAQMESGETDEEDGEAEANSRAESNGYASQSQLESWLKGIAGTPAELRKAAETRTGRVFEALVLRAWSSDHYEVSPITASAALRNTATDREYAAKKAGEDAVQRSVDATAAYREATQVVLVQPARLREFQAAFEGAMETLADWALECGHQAEASAAARAIRACIEMIEKDLAE